MVSTHLKNVSPNWKSSPIFGVKIKNIWNHHLARDINTLINALVPWICHGMMIFPASLRFPRCIHGTQGSNPPPWNHETLRSFFCFFWGAGIIQTKKQQTHGNISRRSTFLPTKTLPKTNIFAPEKGCFEYLSFPFGVSAYFQGRLLLVSGRVLPKENMFFFLFLVVFCHPFFSMGWVKVGGVTSAMKRTRRCRCLTAYVFFRLFCGFGKNPKTWKSGWFMWFIHLSLPPMIELTKDSN